MPNVEKVIKGLECCCVDGMARNCEECPYAEQDGTCYRIDPLLHDALALLKAQEPVKPKRLRNWEREPLRCGSCGALIVIIGNPFTEHVYKAKFCCECGRAVRWT